MLARLNPHAFDRRIKMKSDEHIYLLDSTKSLVSCTTFLSSFHKKFNADEVISKILTSDKYTSDPDYKYYNKTSVDIKKEWSQSAVLGTKLHNDIEKYLNHEVQSNESKEFTFFKKFLSDNTNLTPYRTEWMIFSEVLQIGGAIDAVFVDKNDGSYTIFDWKRSPVSYVTFENYLSPLEHLKDNTFTKYSLQLNLYKGILEAWYNIKIKDMYIIELHPDNESYKKIEAANYEAEIKHLFGYRATFLKTFMKKSEHPGLDSIISTYVPNVFSGKGEGGDSGSGNGSNFNKGKRWTAEEDKKLMDSITAKKNKEDLKEISVAHGRSENAIRLRILHMAVLFLEKNSLEDACEKFLVTSQEIEKFVNEMKGKDSKTKFTDVLDKLKYQPSSSSSSSEGEIEEIRPYKKVKLALSPKQEVALSIIRSGGNLFLTGPGGTGKSFVINTFVREINKSKIVAVTATTGTAAVLLNGTTLFSYLGIGLGTQTADLMIIQLQKKKNYLKRWIELDVLIIDEISMLSPELFDKLEVVARSLRRDSRPFGGIQLILSGDFFQLPNISQRDLFCFDATSWSSCIQKVIDLDFNFRQEEDDIFQQCLSDLRYGKLQAKTIDALKKRENVELKNEYGILPTKIYSLNVSVDEENESQINRLNELHEGLEFYRYEIDIETTRKVDMLEEKMKKVCNAPFVLELCVGAQVMLLFNMDIESKLVNGSRGVIIGFENNNPRVRFLSGMVRTITRKTYEVEENGKITVTAYQIPLKLAYATTIHKSQGCTIDYAEIDMKGIFEYGQGYTALSRVKSLAGLSIKNFNPKVIKTHPRVIEFYKNIE
jgi:ATP-dependent DNA helicase PIF1